MKENCWGLTRSYAIKGHVAHSPTEILGAMSPATALSLFLYALLNP
jgi:hypothetical protein